MTDQPSLTPPDGGIEEHSRRFVIRQSDRLARDFRDLADRIEQEGTAFLRVGSPGRKSYGGIAAVIVKQINGTLANSAVEALIDAASDADIFRATRLAGGED